MANYQADLGLQSVKETVLKMNIKLLRRENKLFHHVSPRPPRRSQITLHWKQTSYPVRHEASSVL